MKTPRTCLGLGGTLLGVICLLLASCQNRSITNFKEVPGFIVSVEYMEKGFGGGTCPYVGGSVSQDNCTSYDKLDLHSYVATNVKIESVVTPAQSGGGYILRFNWTYDHPRAMSEEATRTDWLLYRDESNRPTPEVGQLPTFFGTLTGTNIAEFEGTEWVSEKLSAGKVYTYYFTGQVLGDTYDKRLALIMVLHARIVVDLRAVQDN